MLFIDSEQLTDRHKSWILVVWQIDQGTNQRIHKTDFWLICSQSMVFCELPFRDLASFASPFLTSPSAPIPSRTSLPLLNLPSPCPLRRLCLGQTGPPRKAAPRPRRKRFVAGPAAWDADSGYVATAWPYGLGAGSVTSFSGLLWLSLLLLSLALLFLVPYTFQDRLFQFCE